jgi:hypothetical protein
MSKRAYDSAALTGFEVTVPAPARREPAASAAPAASGPIFEDSWYRTLRVMSDAPSDDVDREGGLVEAAETEQPVSPPALALALSPVLSPLHSPAPEAAARPGVDAPEPPTAPQASPDSYEDSWYQILKSRRPVDEA